MKYLRFVAGCLIVLSVLPIQAKQITVNEVIAIHKDVQSGGFAGRAEWNALTYYLQGVVEGVAGYTESLGKVGKRLLFCTPKGKGYSIEELLKILNQSSQADKNRPASLVILEAYTLKYPCN